MSRKRKVDPQAKAVNGGTKFSGQDIRDILDDYLLGTSEVNIARKQGRSVESINTLLDSKIPRNYTEKGRRTSPIDLLVGTTSKLGVLRDENTGRTIDYFGVLRRAGRSLQDCGVILVLSPSTIDKLDKTYGLPSPNDNDWDKYLEEAEEEATDLDAKPEPNAVSEFFRSKAEKAVVDWDGQSDLELVKLLAHNIASRMWLKLYQIAKEMKEDDK